MRPTNKSPIQGLLVKILYVFLIRPLRTPTSLVLFRFINLLVFTEAPHYAVFSSLLLPLLLVFKTNLLVFSSAPRTSSVGSLSATRTQGAAL
jgi:hypothetical protein